MNMDQSYQNSKGTTSNGNKTRLSEQCTMICSSNFYTIFDQRYEKRRQSAVFQATRKCLYFLESTKQGLQLLEKQFCSQVNHLKATRD